MTQQTILKLFQFCFCISNLATDRPLHNLDQSHVNEPLVEEKKIQSFNSFNDEEV